jgi:hypothetical protein
MISVDTNAPVYSNFKNRPRANERKLTRETKQTERKLVRGTKQTERKLARGTKKAKRNSRRLIRVKRRNGKKVMVYPLLKLQPMGSKFSGTNGQTTIAPVVPTATEYRKTFPDGNSVVIPASQVIVHASGVYDKNDIAKAFNVDPAQINQQMINAYIVGMPPASQNATETNETDANKSNPTGIVVPDENVTLDENGNPYVTEELQEKNEIEKDIKDDQPGEKGKMTKTQKYILIGGGLLVVGIIVYYVMNKGKGKGK